jgi:hypothetical protein
VPALLVALSFCRAAARADRHIGQHTAPHDHPSNMRHQGVKRPNRRTGLPRGTMTKRLRYGPR